MRNLRGSEICIVPQDPNTSLNPVFTTGSQVAESLRKHLGLGGQRLLERSSDLLHSMRIPTPGERLKNYPHEMSGGMRQRVVSAIAISGEPRLILADEPTTALDATTEVQYLDLLLELRARTGVAVIFVTHDFGGSHQGLRLGGDHVRRSDRREGRDRRRVPAAGSLVYEGAVGFCATAAPERRQTGSDSGRAACPDERPTGLSLRASVQRGGPGPVRQGPCRGRDRPRP